MIRRAPQTTTQIIIQTLSRHWFLAGLVLRIFMILAFTPLVHTQWFVPFYQSAFADWGSFLSPWASHLGGGGDPLSFPYGIAAYLAFAPGVGVGIWLENAFGWSAAPGIGLGLTILILDFGLLRIIAAFPQYSKLRLQWLYWLTPIVLFIGYWHGQIDILAVFFMTFSVLLVSQKRPLLAGVVLAVALSAKLAMALIVPILMIYLVRHPLRKPQVMPFLLGLGLTGLVLLGTVAVTPGGLEMVYQTPEAQKLFFLGLPIGEHLTLQILPAVLSMLFLCVWLIRWLNPENLVAFVGIALLVTVSLTPASPGWYLWFIPFVSLIFGNARGHLIALFIGLSTVYVVYYALYSTGSAISFLPSLRLPEFIAQNLYNSSAQSAIFSSLASLALLTGLVMFREGVWKTSYFRMTRRTLAIGIAGDSGAGKDVLADSILDVFDRKMALNISGDDYHIWDRHKPMWQVITHLHPNANHLTQLSKDVLSLVKGKPVRNRHYDHSIGRMTRPFTIQPKSVVISTGLHALLDPNVNQRLDVKIFLDISEDLRRFFKIRRDVYERGHTLEKCLASIERRQPDRERFILPQKNNADLILRLKPSAQVMPEPKPGQKPRLKIEAQVALGVPFDNLIRLLSAVAGVQASSSSIDESGWQRLSIDGDLASDDVKVIAEHMLIEISDVLSDTPKWYGGAQGAMQLLTLNQIRYTLLKSD